MKLLKWSKCPLWLQSCGRILITISVVISLMVVALYILHLIDPEWLKFIHFNTEAALKGEWITSFHGLSIVLLTVGIIAVAWYQLTRLNKISKADFLLRLDERYGSEDILKARRLIAELKRNAKFKYDNDVYLSKAFQNEMIKIRENKESDRSYSRKYIELLNLLDLLETVAYLCCEDYISTDQVKELFGNAINNYEKIFNQWICYFNYCENGEEKAKEEQDYPYFHYYKNRNKALKKEKQGYPYFPKLIKKMKE